MAIATLPRGARLLVAGDFLDCEALVPLVRAAASRFDLTALVLRDPWYDGLPLGGFVRFRDAESGAAANVYVGKRERARLRDAVLARETRALDLLHRSGARTATLDERTGAETALGMAFAIA